VCGENNLLITEDIRQGVTSLLGGLGVLVIIFSLFLDLDFGIAVIIAVFLWLMIDVFKTWVNVDRVNQVNVFNNGKAFVKLLAVMGIWVIVFSIFMNSIPFGTAMVIAISLFIFSGIFSQFLGGSETRHPRRQYVPNPPTVPEFPRSNMDTYTDEGPAKVSCSNCGATIDKADVFCSECGENVK
jgi:hypothetical protein